MIPLLHFTTLITAFLCLFAIQKLYFSYRRLRNEITANFLSIFMALGVFFVVSLPAFLSDPVLIGMLFAFAYIPLLLSPIFFLRVAFNIFNIPGSRYIVPLVSLIIIIVTGLNIAFFSPAPRRIFSPQFYHWGEGTPLWLAIFNGVITALLAMGCSLFFFLGGLQSKDRLVRNRAFLVGGGIGLLVLSALLNYVFSFIFQGTKLCMFLSIFASLLTLPALILVLMGIYHQYEQKG